MELLVRFILLPPLLMAAFNGMMGLFMPSWRKKEWLIGGLVVIWLIYPAVTYHNGTAENIKTKVLQQPFLDGDYLTYEWSGDVVQNCRVTLRRQIVDSEGVVTDLVARSFGRFPDTPKERMSQVIDVLIPQGISDGPAQYLVTEYPECSWLQEWFPNPRPYPPVNFVVNR